MKRKVRVHGKWSPGDVLQISKRQNHDGTFDAMTPEFERKMLQQMIPYLSGVPPEDEPVEIVEMELPW